MNLYSLRSTALASISTGALLVTACAQQAAQEKPTPAREAAAVPAVDARLNGLPSFLLPVPGGAVDVGLPAGPFVEASCEAAFPVKPAMALKAASEKLKGVLWRSASVLGRRKVVVDDFLLSRWPVKNSEYEVFVAQRRQQGRKIRAPYHWWRFGREDDYNSKLADIRREFPKIENGPIEFWDRYGADLPYALKDAKGNSIANDPVTFVDYRDANEFAAWIGMRLPTEAEWTRAARGDGTNVWPWGKDQGEDSYTEAALKLLKIFTTSDHTIKQVGTVPAATGPYGHLDMFAQVWQFVAERGYRPINGADAFAEEWKPLQKDKVGKILEAPPLWKDELVVAKGGSYLSFQDPIQLLVDARAPCQTIDTLESLGFRLAKSLKPGYDVLYSLMRSGYNRGVLEEGQEPDLSAQIGAERYVLGANGFPTSYHAISFAPLNWLTKERSLDLHKLTEKSQTAPIPVGAFATTEPLLGLDVPAGVYTMLYREAGMPRELTDAIKAGYKEVQAALKAKAKGKEDEAKPDEGKEGKDDKKTHWTNVIARYGITTQDLEAKGAVDTIKFVRIDGLEIPTDRDAFLLRGNEGKVIAVIPGTNHVPALVNPQPGSLTLEPDAKGKVVAKFHFSLPLQQQNKRVVDFQVFVTMDGTMPGADSPWRLPK
ncbi:MAG TPA: SUMF1/EgtB/PvdO family nonheme iron enzyme [Planctomycetota bacterium]|nr:SUMF1/EgtB/PvdO family nonheme iron enzyme [Planctomycetota bacterium]